MKLGVLADIHGNIHALEAVVRDARDLAIDRWWALGDLVLGTDGLPPDVRLSR